MPPARALAVMATEAPLRLSRAGIARQGEPIEITVDGTTVPALAGETVAAALTAAGLRALRQTKDGAPRGVYCGMGVCFDCRVTIDGEAGLRSCLTTVKPGMHIRTGAHATDPSGDAAPARPPRRDGCSVLVIGAGPAGLAAAEAAARHGLDVVILDERPASGGQYFKPLAGSHRFTDGPTDAQFGKGAALIERVTARGVRIIRQATVWDARVGPDRGVVVQAVDADGPVTWTAEKLIVAAGAYERSWPVPGWTLPGVMTTGAAQTLARSYQVAPGHRILVAGNGPLNLQVAADLARGGAEVVAVTEAAAAPTRARIADLARLALTRPDLVGDGASYLAALRRRGIPLLHRHVLVRVEGDGRAERAVVAAIDHKGEVIAGSEKTFAVDTVCTGYGFAPSAEITRLIGCRHAVDPRNGVTLIAERDGVGRTSIHDVFIAGDAGGAWGAHAALAQGELAGTAVARDLLAASGRDAPAEESDAPARQQLARNLAFQGALWRVFAMPDMGHRLATDDTLVCRCESVTFGAVRGEIARGARDIPTIKRATRCGMGPCQGRYCAPTVAGLLRDASGETPTESTFFRAQTPVKPVPMRAIARAHPDITIQAPLNETQRDDGAPPDALVARAGTVVIGGGIIGLCSALELARGGEDVIVIERNRPHAEASGANAGSLHVQFQAFGFPDLDAPNTHVAASTLALQRDSVYRWEALAREIGVDLEVAIEGGLTVADDAASVTHLRRKVELERKAGLAMELISGAEARRLAPYLSENILEASLSRDEGKLNPLKASPAVLAAALAAGVRLHEHTRVIGLDRDDDGFLVRTSRGTFRAKRVLNTTGAWAGSIAALVGDLIPIRANPIQMLVTEAIPPTIPYHLAHATRRLTLKQADNGNLIIGGGWKAVQDPGAGRARPSIDGFGANLAVVLEMLPRLGAVQVIRSWTGTAFTTPPVIGESPRMPGLFHAVTQNGMTLGPIVGKINADLILDRRPNYDLRPFSPGRLQ